jgi:MoxR-like ATPase
MQDNSHINQLQEEIIAEHKWIPALTAEVHQAVIGQDRLLQRLILSMIANGHVLLEGVPGLAKTLSIHSLAQACSVGFKRIQFTPDLLPADIVGTMIYNPQQGNFQVRKGPIFSQFILADEINRAPAKVQSALLECMQERQVTIGDHTYPLDEPFLVLATQNPIEQEGTYPLPEAQTDRFLFKVKVSYPSPDEEQLILRQQSSNEQASIQSVATVQHILQARRTAKQIYLDPRIEKYIINLTHATREPKKFGLNELDNLIDLGAGPRASISLALAAKANAYYAQRAFVIPEDVKEVAVDTMQHRLILSYEAQAKKITAEQIIHTLLEKTHVL